MIVGATSQNLRWQVHGRLTQFGLAIASVLATFTLGKAKDEQGNEVDIPEWFTDTPNRTNALHPAIRM
ncbi:hypothetical protein F5050DRAFT_1763590 [Lentinula boryana]|uniref:HIG1 domain-containing protein n=1 Tax=Lentinula boryana TaxID=40481 RepID=A0ABQ8QBS9_9AGAR|nr:hypothetical protein F5050DRAFT_1763590 [Lentinula boryana]